MSALGLQMHMHMHTLNAYHTLLLTPSHCLVTMCYSIFTKCQTSQPWYLKTMYDLCLWFLIQQSLQFCKWGRRMDSLLSSTEMDLVGFWMASEWGLASRNSKHLLEPWNSQPLPSKCPWKGVRKDSVNHRWPMTNSITSMTLRIHNSQWNNEVQEASELDYIVRGHMQKEDGALCSC